MIFNLAVCAAATGAAGAARAEDKAGLPAVATPVATAPAVAGAAPLHECDRLAASPRDPRRAGEGVGDGRRNAPAASVETAAQEIAYFFPEMK